MVHKFGKVKREKIIEKREKKLQFLLFANT